MKNKMHKILKHLTIFSTFSLLALLSMGINFNDFENRTKEGAKSGKNTFRKYTSTDTSINLKDGVFSYVELWDDKGGNKKNRRYQYFYHLEDNSGENLLEINSDNIVIGRTGNPGQSDLWIVFKNTGSYPEASLTNKTYEKLRGWASELIKIKANNIVLPYEYNKQQSNINFKELYRDDDAEITTFDKENDGEKFNYYTLSVYDDIGVNKKPENATLEDYVKTAHSSLIAFRLSPQKELKNGTIINKTLKESQFNTTDLEKYYSGDDDINNIVKAMITVFHKKDTWLEQRERALEDAYNTYISARNDFYIITKASDQYTNKKNTYIENYEAYYTLLKSYSSKNKSIFKWGTIDANDNDNEKEDGAELFSSLIETLLIDKLKQSKLYKNEFYDNPPFTNIDYTLLSHLVKQ